MKVSMIKEKARLSDVKEGEAKTASHLLAGFSISASGNTEARDCSEIVRILRKFRENSTNVYFELSEMANTTKNCTSIHIELKHSSKKVPYIKRNFNWKKTSFIHECKNF